MQKPFIIAVDGPTSSGKSTVAKRLAARYGFDHLNTGLLYRAVGYAALQAKLVADDTAGIIAIAQKLAVDGFDKYFSNPDLQLETSGQWASISGKIPAVRATMLDFQRNFPIGRKGAVVEGRDITSVIFPNAPAKMKVTATPEIRAERRWKELQSLGASVTYSAVLADIQARDARDAWNIDKIPPDAYVLDTTSLNVDETVAAAAAYVDGKLTPTF